MCQIFDQQHLIVYGSTIYFNQRSEVTVLHTRLILNFPKKIFEQQSIKKSFQIAL